MRSLLLQLPCCIALEAPFLITLLPQIRRNNPLFLVLSPWDLTVSMIALVGMIQIMNQLILLPTPRFFLFVSLSTDRHATIACIKLEEISRERKANKEVEVE